MITITLRHQQMMLAVRREMGWPSFKPANDCIAFCSARKVDIGVGSELARISQQVRKDMVYTGWKDAVARLPLSFAVAYRELLTVDIVDRLIPYAANDTAPLILVSTRADEFFAIDTRGSLVRVPGKPRDLRAGKKRAMKRVEAAAATMGDELLEANVHIPPGADWSEPEVSADCIVRFC